MVNVIVSGACGKMGSRIIALAKADPEIEVTGVLEHSEHPRLGQPVLDTNCTLASDLAAVITGPAVVIEFTNPDTTMSRVQTIAEIIQTRNLGSVGIVIGTTGLIAEQYQELARAAERFPILISPNMSIGINLLF